MISIRYLLVILGDLPLHKKILALAIPMVLSNVSTPLLGLIDVAIIGHLEHSWYLGGVALGGTMISVSFWLMGFLRMSTTGLAAQAYGEENKVALARIFLQGIMVALGVSIVFLLVQFLAVDKLFQLTQSSDQVKTYAQQYFSIRAWSAPASLINFVILGWLLGTQNARSPMWLIIIINVANIIFDVLFVVVFDGKVAGAAWASLIADYIGLFLGLFLVSRTWISQQLPHLKSATHSLGADIAKMLLLNRDIFLRSLCLQMVFTFMTFQGAAFGDNIVAANAVLMGFTMFTSYALDGVAYAIEAMVGQSIGAKNRQELQQSLIGSTFWGLVFAAGFTLIYFLFGEQIIHQMTDLAEIQETAIIYLPWLIFMPIITVWCFLFDGIFIGATRGKEMRNTMLLAMMSFFASFYFFREWENHGLWLSMCVFMAIRGLSLGWLLFTGKALSR